MIIERADPGTAQKGLPPELPANQNEWRNKYAVPGFPPIIHYDLLFVEVLMYRLILEYYRNRVQQVVPRDWWMLVVVVCVLLGLLLFDAVHVSTKELIAEVVTQSSSNWNITRDSLTAKGEEVVEPLIAILVNDRDTTPRCVAAEVLGRIGDERAVDPMVSVLHASDSNWQVKESVIEALMTFQPKDRFMEAIIDAAISTIISNLDNPRGYPRENAIRALMKYARYGTASTTDALIAAARNTSNAKIQKAMIELLGRIADDRCVPFLESELCKHQNCKLAAEALDKMGWEPGTAQTSVHYYIAKGDNHRLNEDWEQTKTVLLDELYGGVRPARQKAFHALVDMGRHDAIDIESLQDADLKDTLERVTFRKMGLFDQYDAIAELDDPNELRKLIEERTVEGTSLTLTRLKLSLLDANIRAIMPDITLHVDADKIWQDYEVTTNSQLFKSGDVVKRDGERLSLRLSSGEHEILSQTYRAYFPEAVDMWSHDYYSAKVDLVDFFRELLGRAEFKEKVLVNLALRAEFHELRQAAVKGLADQQVLAKMALEDTSSQVRATAVEKLVDQQILEKIAFEDADLQVRAAAAEKLVNQQVLKRLVLEDRYGSVRMAAIKNLSDQQTLTQIAMEGDYSNDLREAAVEKLTDQQTLIRIALEDEEAHVRSAAVLKITDLDVLAKIKEGDTSPWVTAQAAQRIDLLQRETKTGDTP